MNLTSSMATGIPILILISGIAPNFARAKMNFQDMKGVHALIRPEYEYLSPIYGFTLLDTNTLENIRFYGDYGHKKEGFGCLEFANRIHDQLSKNNDCPQDKTTELIQRLFPSQDGTNFVANQIDSDIVSHLDPETLGRLASKMAQTQDADLTDPSRIAGLEKELEDILFLGLNPQGYYEQQRNSTRSLLKKLKLQSKKKPSEPEIGTLADQSQPTHLQKLEQELSFLDSVLNQFHESSKTNLVAFTPKKKHGHSKDYKELAGILLGALKESRLPPFAYPRNFPEQVLISYFVKKANHKEDFLPLLKGLSGQLQDPSFLKQPNLIQQFLEQKYSKKDYQLSEPNGDPTALAHDLLTHPEKLVFLAEQDKVELKTLPPFLSYAQAKHSSLSQRAYPDCGETSVRNFFNIVLYDSKKGQFNPSFLEEYKKNNPSFNFYPGLISYYKTHTQPAAASNQIARDDWSENVVSQHEEVNYLQPHLAPQCEINAGVDNMMNLIDRLIYQGDPGGGPISREISRDSKIDELCKSLSREGFKLDWELVDSKNKSKLNEHNTGVKLQFDINGKPSFIWEFEPGHFSIKNISNDENENTWTRKMAPHIAYLLNLSKTLEIPSHSPLLLHWFIQEKNWEKLGQDTIHPILRKYQEQWIYTLPLANNEVKLDLFKTILVNAHTNLYPLAKRLQTRLPQNDLQTQQRIEAALADADYPPPWGVPQHDTGNSDLEYTRVPHDSKVLEQLGLSHEKSFSTAWLDPRGMIWPGEALQDSEGKTKALDWKSAKKECFKLNPAEERRKKVRMYYESIEHNSELRDLRKKYLKNRNKENRVLLLKKYSELKKIQISGCFVPHFEDFLLYASDQGYQEEDSKYIPRYFKNFYGNSFWSGSICDYLKVPWSSETQLAGFAMYFDGASGLENGDIYDDEYIGVRCVCTSLDHS